MPNIQLYGFESTAEVFDFLSKAFEKSSLKDEIVITNMYYSRSFNLEGKILPFIRIASTDSVEIEELVKVLQRLGYDIETLVLTNFYPGEKLS